MLPFARRCRDFGVSIHVLDVRGEVEAPTRFPSWIHADTVHAETVPALRWIDIGTDLGMERIQRFVASTGANGLISADELTLRWLARRRNLFEPQCRVMAPQADVLERLLSKQVQVDIAGQAGFDVLKTWYLERAGDGAEIPETQFPICVRPTYPNSVEPPFKAKVLASRPQMTSWLGSLKAIRHPLVAQPFRVGPNLIVHGARDLTGKVLALTGFRTVRKFQGFAQSIERFQLTPKLQENCRRFIEIAGLVGPFHFDLLHSEAEDRTYYLEVNTRMGGTTGKVVGLGYDEPALTLEAFGAKPPRRAPLTTVGLRVTSLRSVARQIVDTLGSGQPDEFRYPLEGRSATLFHSLRELALVNDPGIGIDGLAGSALRLVRPRAKTAIAAIISKTSVAGPAPSHKKPKP